MIVIVDGKQKQRFIYLLLCLGFGLRSTLDFLGFSFDFIESQLPVYFAPLSDQSLSTYVM